MKRTDRNIPPVSKRLEAAGALVREGAVIADIGTDHAYLPIRLTLENRISFAIASDIVDGPLRSAERNIAAFGIGEDRIKLMKTDGLRGVELYKPSDILICGMGGELIARIISGSEYVKDPEISLILQPMTREEKLRFFLAKNGFAIKDEDIVYEDNKLYQLILASYDGVKREISPESALLGAVNIEKKSPEFFMLLEKKIKALTKQINGLGTAGREDKEISSLLCVLEEIRRGRL